MELRHLRYFVAVAELGSISRAAEHLFIAQPPLTTQIRHLEEELGVRLLARYSRGVRLTVAGATFLREAKDILARAERAKRLALGNDHGDAPSIRIGYVPSAGYALLPALIRRLRAVRPEVDLDVREMASAQALHALQRGEIDAATIRLPINSNRIVCIAELNDPFCVAIPEGHALAAGGPIDLREAANEIFIGFSRSRAPPLFDQTIGLFTESGFSPNMRYEAGTLHGVLNLVAAGLGLAVVPRLSVAMASGPFVLRMLRSPARASSLALVRSREGSWPMLGVVAAAADEACAELKAQISGRIGRPPEMPAAMTRARPARPRQPADFDARLVGSAVSGAQGLEDFAGASVLDEGHESEL